MAGSLNAALVCERLLQRFASPPLRRQRRRGELRRDAGGPPLSGQPVHSSSPRRRLPLQRSRREHPAGEGGRRSAAATEQCRDCPPNSLWLLSFRPATASLPSIPGPSRCEPSLTWKPPASAARKWFSRQVRRAHLAVQIALVAYLSAPSSPLFVLHKLKLNGPKNS